MAKQNQASTNPTYAGEPINVTPTYDRFNQFNKNQQGGADASIQPVNPTIPPTDGGMMYAGGSATFDESAPVVGGGSNFQPPSMPQPDIPVAQPTQDVYTPPPQPDYAAQQPTFEAIDVPDPAADRPSATELGTSLGGGATVNTNVKGAESYLGRDGRTLNDISTGEDARAAAETAIYDSMASRLDPRFNQAANDLEISLRNRGLSEGDAAFDNAMANFGREKTDAYNQAMWQSVMGGGQEAQRSQQMDLDRRAQMFGEALGMSQQEIDKNRNELQAQAMQNQFSLGMAGLEQQRVGMDRDYDLRSQHQGWQQQMQGSQYQNQLRQQQIQEEMLRRNQSLNELNALLTGAQVSQPNFNQYNQAGYAGGTDYSGAAQNQYQSTLDAFNSRNAMWQGLMGGASDMYGAGMFG